MTDRKISVCPRCDSPKINRRGNTKPDGGVQKHRWRCTASPCLARFDEPAWREPRAEHTLTGLAARLEQADPEEVARGD